LTARPMLPPKATHPQQNFIILKQSHHTPTNQCNKPTNTTAGAMPFLDCVSFSGCFCSTCFYSM
jgi:hypothetical protein